MAEENKRIEQIRQNPKYMEGMQIISQKERDRVFCRHNFEHCLDVARIAYIINLEEGRQIKKDVIYAMAMLHDLGRSTQYTGGKSHHESGVECAKAVLVDTDFTPEEQEYILNEIDAHKNGKPGFDLLHRADKLSRTCYFCEATDLCYWEEERKNTEIVY